MKRMITLIVILLVISMPIASAASVSIVQNTGTANIPNFINGNGDTWTVKATIVGATNVKPEEVQMVLTSSKTAFNTCEGNVCTYTSPLPNGVAEGSYSFTVMYLPEQVSSVSEVINVDATSPEIIFTTSHVGQASDGSIDLQFIVNEKEKPASGISEIQVIGPDGVIETITLDKTTTFNYQDNGKTNGKLPTKFSGEGSKYIKIVAKDALGHTTTSTPAHFTVDYVKPELVSANLTLGKFIGAIEKKTDLQVTIKESGLLEKASVLASSEDANVDNTPASSCIKKKGNWLCTWNDISIDPEPTIKFNIKVTDTTGNTGELTPSVSLVKDADAPVIKFFGTNLQHQGTHYVNGNSNKIYLEVSEIGSGLVKEDIIANLAELSGSKEATPDKCVQIANDYVCTWDVGKPTSSNSIRINLKSLRDKAGNKADLLQKEMLVDITPPKVKEISLVESSEKKDFFKSGDNLVLDIVVEEEAGVAVLVDMNQINNDAAKNFPEGLLHEEGWQQFDKCVKKDALWHCSVPLDKIKSGPLKNVELNLKVLDTAGNEAVLWPQEGKNLRHSKAGKYRFDILGVDNEAAPDFWKVSKPKSVGFIDLDTTALINTRSVVELSMSSDNAVAKRIIAECSPEKETHPKVKRTLVYGGTSSSSGSVSPTLVIEFEPFDGRAAFKGEIDAKEKLDINYKCSLKTNSQVGQQAVANVEIDDIDVLVLFGFSELGSQEENLQETIKEARDDALTKSATTIATVADWIETINAWNNIIVRPLVTVLTYINVMKGLTDSGRAWPPLYKGLVKACQKGAKVDTTIQKVVNVISIPGNILSCNPNAWKGTLDGYAEWQESALENYNTWVSTGFAGRANLETTRLAGVTPIQARSLRNNLVISLWGVCLPGIVENLEKLAQAQCRYVYCLEKEVPGGLPVSSCEQIRYQLTCKYVMGELVLNHLPLLSGLDLLGKTLKKIVSDPLSLVLNLLWKQCESKCPTSGLASAGCSALTISTTILNQWAGISGSLAAKDAVEADMCNQIKK